MSGLIDRLHCHDERVLHFLVSKRWRPLDLFMRLVTHLADPLPALLVAALIGRLALFTLLVSHLWVQVVKRFYCRARPTLPVGISSLVRAPDRFSFPSGHSAAGMSIALCLVTASAPPGSARYLRARFSGRHVTELPGRALSRRCVGRLDARTCSVPGGRPLDVTTV